MSDTLRRAIEDEGGLVTVMDLAREWGVSKSRVRQIVEAPDFPAPLDRVGKGAAREPQRIWSAEDCELYRLAMDRRRA
jgi:hypothetical protein